MEEKSPISLRKWLSRRLAILTFVALGIVCTVVYISTNLSLQSRQEALLHQKREVIEHLVAEFTAKKDFNTLDHKLTDFFYGRSEFFLRLFVEGTEGPVNIYGEQHQETASSNLKRLSFSIPSPVNSSEQMIAELFLDTTSDVKLRAALAWTLFSCALIGALVVSFLGDFIVRKSLSPLKLLRYQATQISPDNINQRLDENNLAEEIKPLVVQFNALLDRLERAYIQMEGFNADVAHELRTPLANLVGETEFALAAKRPVNEIYDILGSNLEELQRMTAIINDMLLLSNADRGAKARYVHMSNLHELISEVSDYHEAEALEAGVLFKITGDAIAKVDRSLIQRAVSNLISNAVRYSDKDSEVLIKISSENENLVKISVCNYGIEINEIDLTRLFDRFYRSDSSRTDNANHHGLGLAIVSAIARMHGGQPFVESALGHTQIGFTISKHTS
ncbi:heavy metal sensor histidine kinase [Parapusillimonas sp. JC17]|uniref:heavy metal sensor histidine kinase n=1 Tax=Parapusillimonas sp. JC17 TaxID=3445768 RepID=UPI003F9F7C8C